MILLTRAWTGTAYRRSIDREDALFLRHPRVPVQSRNASRLIENSNSR